METKFNQGFGLVGYAVARILLIILVGITFFPFIMMLIMSIKENVDILVDFWGIPKRFAFFNYSKAFVQIIKPIINSLFIATVTITGVLFLSSMAGYSFGRLKFKYKETIFFLFIGVMMIPGVLLVVPMYSTIVKLNLLDTYFALFLPYLSSMQLFGILMLRQFYSTLPEELFEAARMEGANEYYAFRKIGVPMSVPILITIGISVLGGVYNDYFWPTLTLSGESKKTFIQAIVTMTSSMSSDVGLLTAGYVIGSIPIAIIMGSTLKYYVAGMVEGAIKL